MNWFFSNSRNWVIQTALRTHFTFLLSIRMNDSLVILEMSHSDRFTNPFYLFFYRLEMNDSLVILETTSFRLALRTHFTFSFID